MLLGKNEETVMLMPILLSYVYVTLSRDYRDSIECDPFLCHGLYSDQSQHKMLIFLYLYSRVISFRACNAVHHLYD